MFLFRPQGAISEPNEKTVHHPGLELDVVVGEGLGKSPWENGYTPCEEGKMKQTHCDKVERFWNLVLVLDGVQFYSVFLNTQKRTAPSESWEWVRATRAGKTYTTSWPRHGTSHVILPSLTVLVSQQSARYLGGSLRRLWAMAVLPHGRNWSPCLMWTVIMSNR